MVTTVSKYGNILRHNVSWQEFENILAELGEHRAARVAYDRGTLEIMTPLPEHEGYKVVFGDLIKDLADELEIDYESFGSSTLKKEKASAGSEPDDCFYIQNANIVKGRFDIKLSQDPPPDLVLEIDITHKSLNRLPIYARLGIPEIWRYDRGKLYIYQLQGDKYQETDVSLAFPTFPVKEIPNFVAENLTVGRRQLRRKFREWVREKRQDND